MGVWHAFFPFQAEVFLKKWVLSPKGVTTVMDPHGRSSKFLVNRKILIRAKSPLWLAPQMASEHLKHIFLLPSFVVDSGNFNVHQFAYCSEYADLLFFFVRAFSFVYDKHPKMRVHFLGAYFSKRWKEIFVLNGKKVPKMKLQSPKQTVFVRPSPSPVFLNSQKKKPKITTCLSAAEKVKAWAWTEKTNGSSIRHRRKWLSEKTIFVFCSTSKESYVA